MFKDIQLGIHEIGICFYRSASKWAAVTNAGISHNVTRVHCIRTKTNSTISRWVAPVALCYRGGVGRWVVLLHGRNWRQVCNHRGQVTEIAAAWRLALDTPRCAIKTGLAVFGIARNSTERDGTRGTHALRQTRELFSRSDFRKQALRGKTAKRGRNLTLRLLSFYGWDFERSDRGPKID